MTLAWPGAARIARQVALLLALGVAGCERLAALDTDPGELVLTFEDLPAPEAFLLEAPAVRDRPAGAPGLWAAVRGLERPESAEAVNLSTGQRTTVALYRAGASEPAIRLSDEAADEIGVGATPVNVRITALHRRPVVDTR